MDLANLQIEGISRSNYNLKNYEFSSRKILGNRRIIHVSIPDGTLENRKHYSYDMKTINRTTINLRCHQRGQTGKQCQAILSCRHPFNTVEKVLDGVKKSRTKQWTFCDKTTDEVVTTLDYSEYFSPANIYHLVLTEISIENAVEIC